ncbi:hypothetical protein GPZ77_03300 [Streptomyces sp. QHH-9511]|uniref:hypothetical protein n=1 Tax=Streptomyces sp. QHH-9511 TaxID=2684468 RepID=UPI001316A601|nr:hypothetical protein [Streptomyces sp. QHH-9511]QGZ47545.1 hypothetical protein GPZ77_03300 [Streptomyces sp. QHH-9511]
MSGPRRRRRGDGPPGDGPADTGGPRHDPLSPGHATGAHQLRDDPAVPHHATGGPRHAGLRRSGDLAARHLDVGRAHIGSPASGTSTAGGPYGTATQPPPGGAVSTRP